MPSISIVPLRASPLRYAILQIFLGASPLRYAILQIFLGASPLRYAIRNLVTGPLGFKGLLWYELLHMKYVFCSLVFLFSFVTSLTGEEAAFLEHIKYNAEGPNTVGLIQIDNRKAAIDASTWIYVKNALDFYKELEPAPAFVILELDTPGGEVFSAQEISDALKELDTQKDIPVVAFINNWAISAGAMLAYSCRFIAVVKDASMGAAEPVFPSAEGTMVTAPEKVNSALRADFANRAAFFDRNPDIAEAMVDKDIFLVWRSGKVVRLESDDEKQAGDQLISSKGKLLTLNSEQMIKYGVANLALPPTKLDPITEAERVAGKWPGDKMLLLNAPFFKDIPNVTIHSYQMDWKTQLLAFLAMPAVASMLFLAMMIGFYVEINSPGFGLPGSVGLIALFLIVLSSNALEVASWLELILILSGVTFIAIDIFAIPTFGLLGTIGVILTLIGLVGMMLPGIESVDFEFDTQTFNAAGEAFIQRLGWLSGSFVLGCIIIGFLGRYVMPKFSPFQRFVLAGNEQEGFFAGADATTMPAVGAIGEVSSTLRTSGKVVINGSFYDAVTNGEFIEKGTSILVVELQGSVIVVEEKK